MENKKFSGLEKALNVETKIKQIKKETKNLAKSVDRDADIVFDYENTRANLYNLIDSATTAATGALEVAQSTDHPRAYEVASNSIKIAADVTEKLLNLQQKLKELQEEKPTLNNSKTVNNSLFVGSTTELQQFLKQSGALGDV